MENATKALEMAGSVLIGVLLLGCILFAYSQMSELKDTEHKSEVAEQAKDFNQDYEAYNRNNLYGSDMFSLANMIEDYNKKEADGKAYGKIEMKITLKTQIINASFFTSTTYDGDSLNQKYDSLSSEINLINFSSTIILLLITFEAYIIKFEACASTRAKGNPSNIDGNKKISIACNKLFVSFLVPKNLIQPLKQSFCTISSIWTLSGPSPTNSNTEFGTALWTSLNTLIING